MRTLLPRVALAVTALLAAGASPAAAATYHVAPDGSDGGAGTSASPFRTIGRALAATATGDTVLVGPGHYPETASIQKAGVTLRGIGPSRPLVDGGGTRAYGITTAAAGVTVENLEVAGQTEAGIYVRAPGNRVAGNVVHHVGSMAVNTATGIRVANGAGSRVTGNSVHHVGPGGESMGIWLLETRDAVVDDNTVFMVRKEGVRDWLGLDNTIADNRLFLNWTGASLNHSTGSVLVNNYIYDNTEGINVKHSSSGQVLGRWQLTTPHWSRVWHNTVYRSTSTSIGIGLSEPGFDYLDVRDNIFSDAGYTHIRDVPAIRGPNVIMDGNAYDYPTAARRPEWIYKSGWSGDNVVPGIGDWGGFRAQLGWEASGRLMAPALTAPQNGDLDYGPSSPAAAGSLPLDDARGAQLGARGLAPAQARWVPYSMTAVDSSSKGTWWTNTHLRDTADDNQYSYWLTSTADNEYVTYDFGQVRTFNHLVLTLFSHMDKRNPHGYRFDVSSDQVHWRTVLAGTNPDSEGSSYKYELPEPAMGRYLRFTMVDTFCSSYSPRTGCGEYFVLSDLKAGQLTGSDPSPSAGPRPSASGLAGKGRGKRRRTSVALAAGRALVSRGGAVRLVLACRSAARPACRGRVGLLAQRTIARRRFTVRLHRRRAVILRIRRSRVRSLRHRRVRHLRVRLAPLGGPPTTRTIAIRIRG